jgi:Histidine phosphatase superfamily (branch 1)
MPHSPHSPSPAKPTGALLVTHGFVIGWFVRRVVEAPWWRWMSLSQANCALTIVRVSAGEPPALVAFNDTGHLAGSGPWKPGKTAGLVALAAERVTAEFRARRPAPAAAGSPAACPAHLPLVPLSHSAAPDAL